jgi:hypothetical protein
MQSCRECKPAFDRLERNNSPSLFPYRKQLNLGGNMAGGNFASHLREKWILRNNQAKKSSTRFSCRNFV